MCVLLITITDSFKNLVLATSHINIYVPYIFLYVLKLSLIKTVSDTLCSRRLLKTLWQKKKLCRCSVDMLSVGKGLNLSFLSQRGEEYVGYLYESISTWPKERRVTLPAIQTVSRAVSATLNKTDYANVTAAVG